MTYIGSSFLRGLDLSRRRLPERDKSITVSVLLSAASVFVDSVVNLQDNLGIFCFTNT